MFASNRYQSSITMARVILAWLACMSAVPALAFEAFGFRDGMSLDEARTAATLPVNPVSGIEGAYIVGASPNSVFASLSFCRDRLFAASQNLAGGLPVFVSEANRISPIHGSPTTTFSQQNTNGGPYSEVRLTWHIAEGEELDLSVSSFSDNPPTVSISYSSWAIWCS